MLDRRPLFQCLQIIALALACAAKTGHASPAQVATPPMYRILEPSPGEFPLTGPWQFHLGDNSAWKSPAFDDSAWEQLTADEPWGAQGHANTAGFAWYRRHIEVIAGPSTPPQLSILIPPVEDAYELYWNGNLVGSYGKLPPQPVWYYVKKFNSFDLGPPQSGVLAVRVWKAPFISYDDGLQGGFSAPPVIGSPLAASRVLTTVEYRGMRDRQFLYGLNALYALVAVLGLMAWRRDRNQWAIFWMVVFALSKPLSLLLLLGGLPITIMLAFYAPVYGLGDISLWFLLLWLLDLHGHKALVRWTKVLAIAAMVSQCLDGLTGLGLPTRHWEFFQILNFQIQFVCIAFEFFPILLVVVAVARRRHLPAARWFVALFAFLSQTTLAAAYALSQGARFTHWTLSSRILVPLFTVLDNRIDAQTIFDTLLLISIVYAVYRNSVESRNRQIAFEQELKNARELQQVLIPEDLPAIPGYILTSAYKPASEVGGDFFQIIPVEAGTTLIVLGDVSGKGLKAAMAVALIVGTIRTLAEMRGSPAEVLEGLNRRLYGRLQGGFATCIAAQLDTDGNCVIASAGHLLPFLNDQEMELEGAFPLGLAAGTSYEERTLRLDAGDRLALFTDGLLEARNANGELYGFDRLKALFASNPSAEQAAEAAVNFGQDDDITVLTLTRLDTGVLPMTVHAAAAVPAEQRLPQQIWT